MTTTMTRKFMEKEKAAAWINIETPEQMKFASETLAKWGVKAKKWARMSLTNEFEGVVWVTQDEDNRLRDCPMVGNASCSGVQGIIDTVHAMSDAGLMGNENEQRRAAAERAAAYDCRAFIRD